MKVQNDCLVQIWFIIKYIQVQTQKSEKNRQFFNKNKLRKNIKIIFFKNQMKILKTEHAPSCTLFDYTCSSTMNMAYSRIVQLQIQWKDPIGDFISITSQSSFFLSMIRFKLLEIWDNLHEINSNVFLLNICNIRTIDIILNWINLWFSKERLC